jgi:hypothetical protein
MPNWIPDIGSIDDLAPPFGVDSTDIDTAILNLSPAIILGSYLVNDLAVMKTVASEEDWPLYLNFLPDDQPSKVKINAGAIYDTSGILDGRLMETGEVIEHHGVQLKIRCETYPAGWKKIRDVVAMIQKIKNTTVIVNAYSFLLLNISMTTTIVNIGLDEQRRWNFIVNFLMSIKKLTAAYGTDIVIDGAFDDNTKWTASGNAAVHDGVATFDCVGGATGELSKILSLTPGRTYKLVFTTVFISNTGGGTLSGSLGGTVFTIEEGINSVVVICGSDDLLIKITATGFAESDVIELDNLSAMEVYS